MLKEAAQKEGMQTMIENGLTLLSQTTLSEIVRVIPIEILKDYKQRFRINQRLKS